MTVFLLSLAVIALSVMGMAAGILLKRPTWSNKCGNVDDVIGRGAQNRDCWECRGSKHLRSQISNLKFTKQ